MTKYLGLQPFIIPNEVYPQDYLHLNQEQVTQLIPQLQHFVNTGELPD